MRRAARRALWALLLGLWCQSGVSVAQSSDQSLEQAKGLFREGVALLNAGDPERALDYFLRSRAIVPSGKNTANAAICLDRLGRYDEALELYEELLSRFSADLDQQDRENLAPIMATLRERLGKLEISASVDGSLVVDSKPRGQLPRTTPLRLLPGRHRVRVVKEGYRTFEQIVDVTARETVALDADLEPLAGLGALRVEQAGGGEGQFLVDGKVAGVTPWEGTLSIGPHVVQLVAGERGSMPEVVEVIERRTLFLRLATKPLGQTLRVTTSPRQAMLFVGDVRLGSGGWSGRLPAGNHELRASATGYLSHGQTLVSNAGAEAQTLSVTLRPRPRMVSPPSWFFAAGLDGGLALAPTLNGGHEAGCPTRCQGGPAALGGRAEAALTVEHRLGFGGMLALGYAFARQEFSRWFPERYGGYPIYYALTHELVFGGPYGRAGVRGGAPLFGLFELHGEVGFGLLYARYEAAASGEAWTTAQPVPAATLGLEPQRELAPFVTTALELERRFGPVGLSASLGAWFFPRSGPSFPDAQTFVVPNCPLDDPSQVGCAGGSSRGAETVHGPFVLLTPSLGARYHF